VPTVTIDDRTVEVEAGANLVDAALKAGVQIPHYCYHPRLSIVGQCRMCLVEIEVGGKKMPKLQAGCSTVVERDGMVVRTKTPEVHAAQQGMMEFLLLNHPLDCPICDQAGECGLQDYSFKHGVAYSRFRYEDKRTYPGRERIPLGPTVLLNMNRCIQCTRCVRFTHEISGTNEIGFFNRGARAEIGVFPGKELDNDLSTCVVDVCPVGALTSTQFRFAERVFYLDKQPSICTGCEVGCNITIEHRRGKIRRLKPRFNPEVNDFWMCDTGRATFERYQRPRLTAPRVLGQNGAAFTGWKEALDLAARQIKGKTSEGTIAFLGSGFLTTEEAYLLSRLADQVGSRHRAIATEDGKPHHIPNLKGGVSGVEAAPNRRGAELAGLGAAGGGNGHAPFSADDLLSGDAAARCAVLVVDGDFGTGAHDPEVVARLRQARTLIVFGWEDSLLAQAADIALPWSIAPERDGTFVNVQYRVQKLEAAFPPPGQVRSGVEVLSDLLSRFDPAWADWTPADVFDQLATEIPAFAGLTWDALPATGAPLAVAGNPGGGANAAALSGETGAPTQEAAG
jgi:NADH-quinone oxidoreductase subunit G